ncbi:hypothetical protein [Pseudomonas umsongensis]|uniref:hypothetical protein n=1 Tax=Pseudomonas umsongensis TaxID=198618 RepID=UPI003D7FF9A2
MNQSITAVTQSQLADLAGLSPSFISVHLDELPESFFLRDGRHGRAPRAWTVEQVVEFVLAKTEALTELECRLRVALLNHESRRSKGTPRLVDEAGVCHVIPSDLRDLTPEELDLFRRAREADQARVRSSRAKRIPNRSPSEE